MFSLAHVSTRGSARQARQDRGVRVLGTFMGLLTLTPRMVQLLRVGLFLRPLETRELKMSSAVQSLVDMKRDG